MLNVSRANSVLSGLLLAVATIAAHGCGSSSSSSNPTDICNRACVKTAQCFGGTDAGDTTASCKSECMTQTGTTTCTNESQIANAANACLAMSDCTAFLACAVALPKCQGGSNGGGQGGSNGGGTGGSSGGNGDAGAGASCSSCDKAGTCCVALATLANQSSAACASYSTASCNAMAAGTQAQFAATCAALLNSGASVSASCR